MLDVSLDAVSFAYDTFALRDLTLTFAKSTHTAVVGAPGCGSSTLLKLIAGEIRPQKGDIRIGTRIVTTIGTSRRPLLYATGEPGVSGRWSVHHALVNAVSGRKLDREERYRELSMAAAKWDLERLLDRKMSTLGATEGVRVHLARIELLRPAILVADRLLALAASPSQTQLADEIYRMLRIMGTTFICAPATLDELGFCDSVVVLDGGRVVQRANASQVFGSPAGEAAAVATGAVNAIPVRIRGNRVESAIGEWTLDAPPFEGSGVALVRPDDFRIAASGEDSELIFGIEEASFQSGRWIARGLLSGGLAIRVVLPRDFTIRKGRLIPLSYDPATFTLLPREGVAEPAAAASSLIPPMRDTR